MNTLEAAKLLEIIVRLGQALTVQQEATIKLTEVFKSLVELDIK